MEDRYDKVDFGELEEMVRAHNSSLVDINCPLEEMHYQFPATIAVADKKTQMFGNVAMEGTLNGVGYNELCGKLGAPTAWLKGDKCPPDLEEHIINRLKQGLADDSLFRFRQSDKGAICRAVLSNQYLIYNHQDFYDDVAYAIKGSRLESLNPMVWKPFVSDSLDTWILFDSVNADPDKEQPRMYDGGGFGGLKPAIHLRNSEDGTGRVRIDSGFFRSYCANGVIFGYKSKDSFQAVHRGNSKWYMRSRVSMAIAEAARNCKVGIAKFLEAVTVEIKDNVLDDIVTEWSKDYKVALNVTEEWQKAVYRSRTWGDVVMATSDFAGTQKDRDAQTQLEEIAGAMLMTGARKYSA